MTNIVLVDTRVLEIFDFNRIFYLVSESFTGRLFFTPDFSQDKHSAGRRISFIIFYFDNEFFRTILNFDNKSAAVAIFGLKLHIMFVIIVNLRRASYHFKI